MPKYDDEFNIDDVSEQSASTHGHRDEESARVSISGDSVEAFPAFSFKDKNMAPPPVAPPVPGVRNGTKFAAHDGGEDFSAADIPEPNKHNSRRSLWLLVAAILFLLVAAVAAVFAILSLSDGGGVGSENKAASSSSDENKANSPPTPAPISVNIPKAASPSSDENKANSPPTPAPIAVNIPTPQAPTPYPTWAPQLTAQPTSEVYHFVKSRMPDGGLSLSYDKSYQSVALQFVLDTYVPGIHDEQRLLQRFALACIYKATYNMESAWTLLPGNEFPSGWLDDRGWLDFEDECTWKGIVCNNNGNVIEIDLSGNYLTGIFPPETVMLKNYLKRLLLKNAISYNYDDYGINWLGEMTRLEELDLSGANFQFDGIPTAFGKLTNLVDLDVSYTLMHGRLQDDVFKNLKKLEYLHIGGNSYHSSLPDSIGKLNSLKYFYANDCDLTGDLSVWKQAGQTPNLLELWIYDNPKVTGSIPTEIGQYSSLASLAFSDMDLTGNLPTELGMMSNMEQMWFNGNRLSGIIPSQIGNLGKLKLLEVQDNDLTGAMPNSICLRYNPMRQINYLWADCDPNDNPKVACTSQCCLCCGRSCDFSGEKTNGGRMLAARGTAEERRDRRRESRRAEILKMNSDPVYAKSVSQQRYKRIVLASQLERSRKLGEQN